VTIESSWNWSAVLMPLIGLLNLVISTTIAILVYRFTRRQAAMETLKLINSRWQEMNKLIIERPEIQRLIGDPRFAGKTDEDIIAYNFLFQILNVCHEVHLAGAHGLINREVGGRFIRGNVDILRNRRADVIDMLKWSRGYDPEFIAEMQRLLSLQSGTIPSNG
jgi:hypothetical protein